MPWFDTRLRAHGFISQTLYLKQLHRYSCISSLCLCRVNSLIHNSSTPCVTVLPLVDSKLAVPPSRLGKREPPLLIVDLEETCDSDHMADNLSYFRLRVPII